MFGFEDRPRRRHTLLYRDLTVAEIAIKLVPIAVECGVIEAYMTYSGPKHPGSDRPECIVLVFRTYLGDEEGAKRFSRRVEPQFRRQIAVSWAPALDSDMEYARAYGVEVPLRSLRVMFIRVPPMGSACRIR